MHPISLAAGVLPDHSPQTTARAAAVAGYDATGVWVDLEQWTPITTRDLRAVLAEHALPVLDVEVVWLREGPFNDAHLRVVDIGREIGAHNLLVVSSDPDDHATAAKLARLCEYAEDDIRIALEFGLFTAVKTVEQAIAILSEVDQPAAALLIDPLHLARSGGATDDVAHVPKGWLSYAQLCDAGPLNYDIADRDAVVAEAVDGRHQIGEGILPLAELLDILPGGLPLSVELRSKALRDAFPEPTDRARIVLAAARRFMEDRSSATRPTIAAQHGRLRSVRHEGRLTDDRREAAPSSRDLLT
jgi:sugar phosphate isomerase/epimerase